MDSEHIASSRSDGQHDQILLQHYDCVVVGSGHAGSCAALAAKKAGCTNVLIIDKCPEEWAGGNGYFTAGAHRTAHNGLPDLLPLLANAREQLTPERLASIEIEPYTTEQFAADINRLGGDRADQALVREVVEGSREALGWLAQKDNAKIPFVLSFNRQAYEVGGVMKFWGGMCLSVEGGGKGLIEAWRDALRRAGVETRFETEAVGVVLYEEERKGVCGVVVRSEGNEITVKTRSVVLAAGGFEANREMRCKYLGEEWVNAKVRGTPYNTGDGFTIARAAGAKLTGDWAGCHSTAWDAHAASDTGNRELTNQYTKSGYPLGVMINLAGNRFVDEGEDFRNYTYAKFGRAILAQQPGGCAFQVWDAKVLGRLREEEYGEGVVRKAWAGSLEKIAEVLGEEEWGLRDKKQFVETVTEFNEAVRAARTEAIANGKQDEPWNPAIKDGYTTQSTHGGLEIPKSNWALTIEDAPLMAVKVACGITFTFGGVAIDPKTAEVISKETGAPIPGLFCTGEMVGGLFYGNYPGGSGLTAGAVFGIRAGQSVAKRASGK